MSICCEAPTSNPEYKVDFEAVVHESDPLWGDGNHKIKLSNSQASAFLTYFLSFFIPRGHTRAIHRGMGLQIPYRISISTFVLSKNKCVLTVECVFDYDIDICYHPVFRIRR